MKEFTVRAEFDPETGVWWASNDELPLTTEAQTLDLLVARVMAIASTIAGANGHAKTGERVKIHFTADQEAAVGG
jgi:hypothetical protein